MHSKFVEGAQIIAGTPQMAALDAKEAKAAKEAKELKAALQGDRGASAGDHVTSSREPRGACACIRALANATRLGVCVACGTIRGSGKFAARAPRGSFNARRRLQTWRHIRICIRPSHARRLWDARAESPEAPPRRYAFDQSVRPTEASGVPP